MGEIVPIIFLAVVLKVPVFFGMWLIYAAVRSEPVADGLDENGDDHGFRRWRREPKPPRGQPNDGVTHVTAEPRASTPFRPAPVAAWNIAST